MDENVRMDETAMQAEMVVKAAIRWYENSGKNMTNRYEWELLKAVEWYGDEFKGLRETNV